MNKILLIAACLMLLCEVKCFARIGETLEQCEKRYGKRITDKTEIRNYIISMGMRLDEEKFGQNWELITGDYLLYFFRLELYVISLKVYNNKVVGLMVMKNISRRDGAIKMSDEEINTIIDANIKGEKCEHWIEDYFNVLVIVTEEEFRKLDKKKADEKKEQYDKEKNVLKKF